MVVFRNAPYPNQLLLGQLFTVLFNTKSPESISKRYFNALETINISNQSLSIQIRKPIEKDTLYDQMRCYERLKDLELLKKHYTTSNDKDVETMDDSKN